MSAKTKTFWLDGFEGKARGGVYVRSNLHEQLTKFKKNEMDVVGLIVEEGSFDVEMLIREKDVDTREVINAVIKEESSD